MEVIGAVEQVTGRHVAYRLVGRRPGDPPKLVAMVENAATLLGWKPQYVDIQSIISTAWNWHASQLEKQNP
jgi:UDP-glucose 4-epimerase